MPQLAQTALTSNACTLFLVVAAGVLLLVLGFAAMHAWQHNKTVTSMAAADLSYRRLLASNRAGDTDASCQTHLNFWHLEQQRLDLLSAACRVPTAA
jgi:hypothetical protein